jgi:cobyrinic acid a,c-diamide synthase
MYLGESLRVQERTYPMAGVLPLMTEFRPRPQGHGYTTMEVVGKNPFFPCRTILKGHEFHYSRVVSLDESRVRFAFGVRRGRGIDGRRDGLVRWNVLATYTHLHVLGCPQWAEGMAAQGRRRSEGMNEGLAAGGGLP